ncbi:MAG: DUF2203 domain-containing protein [Moorea sp. SIO1F2]|uniref:DUF2203 domain-containing protein n=1 Tax=unclassified Moorena TaxID=2683338 RepID=UPI0013BD4AAB|nr:MULTISPECIES: DUF2203 domain-containing protein [unclassified Moorena]NEN96915.1 DUF2203 domain-containing protein [Moorena sp. SIO3I7]NEO04192.1 DUF2203 domain-containing protein [Moorena sp. SIO3I8]NEO11696.1 DUF2203 domain-containing protein [Moorena sp. SIO3E8]NEP98289.1 DUF2203 domain-containing protein [Moorena sp. SIO3F7]NET85188.1 DUF2203 domain-containing protein [Moorena sp. SIO1F2]
MPPESFDSSYRNSAKNREDQQDVAEFEEELGQIERSLNTLKKRYTQVQRDQRQQAQLQERREQVRKDLRKTKSNQTNSNKTKTTNTKTNRQALKAELRQIQEQLEVLELNLESQLFSWHSLREPFWHGVRFGGLGLVIGWILRSCVS